MCEAAESGSAKRRFGTCGEGRGATKIRDVEIHRLSSMNWSGRWVGKAKNSPRSAASSFEMASATGLGVAMVMFAWPCCMNGV